MKNPTKNQILKWTNALRSGKFEQGQNTLQRNNKFCCLGIGCLIFIPAKKQIKADGVLLGHYLNEVSQPNAPQWLKNIDKNFDEKTGLKLSDGLNDKDYTFDEIADCLELVYIHKILD